MGWAFSLTIDLKIEDRNAYQKKKREKYVWQILDFVDTMERKTVDRDWKSRE